MNAVQQDLVITAARIWERMPPEDKEKYPELMEGIEACERASVPKREAVFTVADEITLQIAEARKWAKYQAVVFAATVVGIFGGMVMVWAVQG